MRIPLSQEIIQRELAVLSGWYWEENKIHRKFVFHNFQEAMAFLVRISFLAEKMDHHPEIHNIYNQVLLSLTTHDAANQVTEMDIALAKKIQKVL